MKKGISARSLSGVLVSTFGLSVIIGWYARVPALVSVSPNYVNMTFNTALCFFISGIGLISTDFIPLKRNYILQCVGIFIFAMAFLTLSQVVFHYTLGIDHLFIEPWKLDQNPYPGRMSGNTAVAFMISGFIFILLPLIEKKWIAALVQFLIFAEMLLGVTGLLGYLFNIEFFYSWFSYSRMALHASCAFIILGMGIFLVWKKSHAYHEFYKENEDKKIFLVSIVVLLFMAFIAGLSGFIVSAKQNQSVIAVSMQQLLQDKTNWLQHSIQQSLNEMTILQNGPLLKKIIQGRQSDAASLQDMDKILMNTGFSSIEISDNDNKPIYTSGKFTATPKDVMHLSLLPFKSNLFESDGSIILQLTSPVIENNQTIGSIFAEWRYTSLENIFSRIRANSRETYSICSYTGKKLICIPSMDLNITNNQLLTPVGLQELRKLLVAGKQGVLTGTDYSNKSVLVAYRPTEIKNLGVVIKMDLASVYFPLKNQLKIIVPILFAIIFLGAVILYRQILPLVKNMIRAKKYANDMNTRLKSIINNVDEGIIVANEQGIIEEFNPKAAQIFGYKRVEAVGKNIQMLIPGEFSPRRKNGEEQYFLTKDSHLVGKGNVELSALHKEGKKIPVELAFTEMFLEDNRYFVGIMRDITERKKGEAKLKESEERFRSAFVSSAIGMAIIATDERFIQVNDAFCHILGYTQDELLNSTIKDIIISQDLKNAEKKRKELLDDKIKYFHSEERYHHKSGQTVWLLLTYSIIRMEEQDNPYFIVQVQDITEQKKSEEQLAYQAYYDSLTGLANRAQLEHNVNNLISNAKRYHKKFAVFFLDLDKFKHINDTFGHDAGDKLLSTVAERLSNSVRKTDIVARLGGDEFVLVLTDIGSFELVASFTEKLINVLCHPIKIKENDFFITTSIGISIYPVDGKDFQTLLKNADLALYQAKEAGRNNYQFCTPEMGKTIHERLNLENALKSAIICEEFQLHYQPQIDIVNEKVIGFEAFVRWSSKEYGLVSPQKLLSIAEETGLIIPLTEWIIKTAFIQIGLLNKAGFSNLDISINLSARQFMCDQLVSWIQASLQEANISPNIVKLEIKESLLLQISDNVLEKLQKLRQQGIKIIIDDFGTGYSSLSYLQSDIVDCIKIDDSLTQSVVSSSKSRDMVIAIINLAKNLGIKVIAEGVETSEQCQFLKQQHCNIIQGYFISKPLAHTDLTQFLNAYAAQYLTTISSE